MLKIDATFYLVSMLSCITTNSYSQAPKQGSPIDNLPAHITRLTYFGQRADWSHDGKRILFIEKTYGDVYEIDLVTKAIRPKTHHYYHEGYTRVLYLSNGDVLLSGARSFYTATPGASRSEENAEQTYAGWLVVNTNV